MAIDVAAGGAVQLAAIHADLWPTDPRVQPNLTAGYSTKQGGDQWAGLQAMMNLLATAPSNGGQPLQVCELIPGAYSKNGELVLANNNPNAPISIYGKGSKGQYVAPTIIQDLSDAGSGKYALNVNNVAGPFQIQGVAFSGSLSPPGVGNQGWGMRGLSIPTACTLRDVSIQGYYSGVDITGDHILIEDFDFTGNMFAIHFPPRATTLSSGPLSTGSAITSLGPVNPLKSQIPGGTTITLLDNNGHSQSWNIGSAPVPYGSTSIPVQSQAPNFAYPSGSVIQWGTQGDITIRKGRASSSFKACIAVARSAQMAGVRIEDVALSNGPVSILYYDDGTGVNPNGTTGTSNPGTWMTGCDFINVATEYTGNAILYDLVGNGAQVSDLDFDHGSVGNWGLYSAYVWSGGGAPGQVAAWYNTGTISDIRFKKSLPTATATQPSLKASSTKRIWCPISQTLAASCAQGKLPIAVTGSVAGAQGAFGDKRGGEECVTVCGTAPTIGAVTLGYCVVQTQQYYACQYGSGALSAPLNPAGGNINSLPVGSWAGTIPSGSQIIVQSGNQSQAWTTSGPTNPGAASISVANQTPNFAFPSGSVVYVGTGRVIGIAAHNAAANAVLHIVESGTQETVVNTSAAAIVAGAILVPDPGGGVAAGVPSSGLQELGVAYATIAAGASGAANLRIS